MNSVVPPLDSDKPSFLWLLLPFAFAALVTVLVPHGLSAAIVGWNSGRGSNGAGWLMVALFAYVAWQERAYLLPKRVNWAPSGVLLIAVVAVLTFVAYQRQSITISCAATAAAIGAVWVLIFGWASAIRVGPVLALLAFALPMWSWFREPLQAIAAFAVATSLPITGLSTHLDGTLISVPAGVFAVEEGCSGLNYLLVSLSVAFAACVLARKTPIQIVGIALMTACFALAVNWIRIAIIVFVGNQTEMQSALVADHVTFGWILFSVLFVPYCLFVLPEPQLSQENPE